MSIFDRLRRREPVPAPAAPEPPLPVESPPAPGLSVDSRPAAAARLDEVSFCIVDVETTGLTPDVDRVLEIAVIRCDSRGATVDEWHTVVNPRRPVDGQWIHGIDDAMVADAPTFDELAPRLLASLDGAVLVAHNAAFDRRFVEAELLTAGYAARLPYLCTMHMRRHVGHHAPVMHRLSWACWQAGIPLDQAHAAISDARAVAGLLRVYLDDARVSGHQTLERLALTAAAADACAHPLLTFSGPTAFFRPAPRGSQVPPTIASPPAGPEERARYQAALAVAVEDLVIDGDEVEDLRQLVADLGLGAAEIGDAHREFMRLKVTEYLEDGEFTWEEYEQYRILGRLLAVDGRWLEEHVADVRPRHVAATLPTADPGVSSEHNHEVLAAPISVCFTGPFEAMPLTRTEVQALAADAGMEVRSGVSAKLDLLVCRDPYAGTSKLRKAELQGTVVVDQETFLAIAGAATPSPSPTAAVLNTIAARRRARSKPTARQTTDSHDEPSAKPLVTSSSVQMLWCDPGGHEWSRPAQRGRPPKKCPEH